MDGRTEANERRYLAALRREAETPRDDVHAGEIKTEIKRVEALLAQSEGGD